MRVEEQREQTTNPDVEAQYLTFMLADEEYGIDILQVQEIRSWEEPTIIPESPKFVRGVINLRGAIVPIIDLREKFNFPSIDYSKFTVVVVVQVQHHDRSAILGLVVDAVSDVHTLSDQDIRDVPEGMNHVDQKYLKGLAVFDKKMIILLNCNNMISLESIQDIDNIPLS